MMIYLIIDTNNWIYLASSKNPDTESFEDGHHIKLFDTLIKKVESGDVELLLCSIIEDEWKRNKSEAEGLIRKYQNEIESYKGVVKKIGSTLDSEDKKSLTALYNKYVAKAEAKIKENEEHIEKVEALIQMATKYTVSKEIKAFAADWALEKKAPFKGDKKNSMADALIFFGAIEYLKEDSKTTLPWSDEITYDFPTSIFVSGNKGDFSNSQKADELHEDLKSHADEVHLNFFRSLPAALNFIQEELAAQPPIFTEDELMAIEKDVDELSDDWYTCDVCTPSEENQYTNMVYFYAPYEIEVENENIEDPNQLKLEFADLLPSEKKESKPVKIRTGECSRCGTTHLLCECGTVTPIEGDNENGFQCEGCATNYLVKNIRDRHGIYTQEIVIDNRIHSGE